MRPTGFLLISLQELGMLAIGNWNPGAFSDESVQEAMQLAWFVVHGSTRKMA